MTERVAVACDGELVGPHSGRCERFLLAEVDGQAVTVVGRLQTPEHEPGLLPRLRREHNMHCVLAGGAGPRAVDTPRPSEGQGVPGALVGQHGERGTTPLASGSAVQTCWSRRLRGEDNVGGRDGHADLGWACGSNCGAPPPGQREWCGKRRKHGADRPYFLADVKRKSEMTTSAWGGDDILPSKLQRFIRVVSGSWGRSGPL
jgi:hypothetical protein